MCFILSNNSVANTKNLYQKIPFEFEFDCTEIFKKKVIFNKFVFSK